MNKTWTHRLKKGGMALLRGILYLLVFVSFLLTVLSFSLKRTVGNRESYRNVVKDPAVAKELLGYARDDLEMECLFYGLSYDIIDQSLTQQDAADFSLQYIDAVYDAVFVTGKLDSPTVDPALFRPAIAKQLEAEEVDDTVIDQLAAEFAAVTTSVWQLGLNQKLLTPAHRIAANRWVTRFMNSGPALAGITALLILLGVVVRLRRVRRQAFTLCGVVTLGSMLLFVPLWLLNRYGLAERLVLGASPLRSFVVRWLNATTAELSAFTLRVMIVCVVLTVAATVWLVWPKRKDEKADETDETAPSIETAEAEDESLLLPMDYTEPDDSDRLNLVDELMQDAANEA